MVKRLKLPDGGGPVYVAEQEHEAKEGAERAARRASDHVGGSGLAQRTSARVSLGDVLPLLVLVVPAILSGLLNLNGGFGDLVKGALPRRCRESTRRRRTGAC